MKRLSCESCGADLPTPDARGYSRCTACGQTSQVEVPAPPPAPRPAAMPPVVINIDRGAGSSAPKAIARTGVGCLVGVVILVVGGIIAALAIAGTDSTGRSAIKKFGSSKASSNVITLSGSLRPISAPDAASGAGSDGATDSVAVIQEYTDASHRYLARLDVGREVISERWRSPELPEGAYGVSAARSGDTVFAAVGDQVWALDEATGKRRWIADLTDEVSANCNECFVVVGDRLVVRTNDSQLTGFSSATPDPGWRLRLDSPSATVSVLSGRLFVLDDKVQGDDPGVRTVDPLTGQTTNQFTPGCDAPPPSSRRVQAGTGHPIVPVPDSTDLVMVFASGGGCVVRWDPATNAVRYANVLPDLFSIDDDHVVAAGRDLVVLDESASLVRIDLESGQVAPLDPIADVRAIPDRIVGNTLVTLTKTDRGSPRGGVAAWDLRSGRLLWQVEAPDKAQAASTSSSDALFAGAPRSVLVYGLDDLHLLVFDDDRTFTASTITLASGALRAGRARDFEARDSGTVSMTVEAVEPSRVVVTFDSLLESIPTGSGDPVTFPPSD